MVIKFYVVFNNIKCNLFYGYYLSNYRRDEKKCTILDRDVFDPLGFFYIQTRYTRYIIFRTNRTRLTYDIN